MSGPVVCTLPPAAPPFVVEAPHRVVPTPRPLAERPHVVVDAAWPAALDRRLQRLLDEPGAILVRDPGQLDDHGLSNALRAAWAVLPRTGLNLLGLRVDLEAERAEQIGPSLRQDATDAVVAQRGWELLALAWGLACADDLVVLRRAGPGQLRAELLAVAFPSGWSPRDRAGASLTQLHAPVADGARLQRASAALSEALLTKGPYLQHVWGLDRCGRLDQDPRSSYDDEPLVWHLRVERQTSVPLPHLDRALFTIRPYLTPLTELTPDQRGRLGQALASMSPESLAYKGVPVALVAELNAG